MKKIFVLLLAALMLFSLIGCKSDEPAPTTAPETLPPVTQAPREIQGEVPKKGAAEAPTEAPGEPVMALNATINGETSLRAENAASLTAEAVIPEGMAVDCWAVNGVADPEATGPSYDFTVDGQTVVEALLRPRYTVTAINADMQFLDGKDQARGETFTEFDFEDDYVNPVTQEEIPGGTVSFYIRARIPKGYDISYWLIDGVPYRFTNYVNGFRVTDLDQAKVYEPVFWDVTGGSKTPPQTTQTTQTEPPATEDTTVYYSVSCEYCTFSGGGTGGTSGRVPAGTVITVSSSVGDAVYWEGSYATPFNQVAPAAFSYTVNSNCHFRACGVVN